MSTFSGYMFESSELQEPVLPDVDVESIVKDEDVEAAYEENMVEAAARIVAESTINWNNILEACTITEFCYLEENHQEFVYEAGALSSFFEKAKKFFLNIWEKIKAIFKKAMMQFTSIFSSDKDFINKYEKTIISAKNQGFKEGKEDAEIAIYPFPWLTHGADSFKSDGPTETAVIDNGKVETIVTDLKLGSTGNAEEWKKANDKFDSDVKDTVKEEYRASWLTTAAKYSSYNWSGSTADAAEFTSELKNILNGSDTKEDVKVADVISDTIKYLKDSAKIKKALNKYLKDSKTAIDKEIKALNAFDKTLKSSYEKKDTEEGQIAGAKHSIITKYIDLRRFETSLITTIDAAVIQSLKACSSQCKSVCVKAVSLAKTTKHEGATITSESSMSLLDGIDLV